MAETVAFTTGQIVRLRESYTGKPLSYANSVRGSQDRSARVLPAGTAFRVVGRDMHGKGYAIGMRLDGPTALLKGEGGTWCIPVRLLEAVPSDSVATLANPPTAQDAQEPGRDGEGHRNG